MPLQPNQMPPPSLSAPSSAAASPPARVSLGMATRFEATISLPMATLPARPVRPFPRVVSWLGHSQGSESRIAEWMIPTIE